MNILIVDDSIVTRTFLTDMLHDAGYNSILQAESMEEVFTRFCCGSEATCSRVDLVLLDIHLPGKDGIEGCHALKQLEEFQDVPIIMISSLDQMNNLEAAFSAGAIDYLAKPPNMLELKARVGSALKLKGEIDNRKAREQELLSLMGRLEEVNFELQHLLVHDGLTGVANRHAGNNFLAREWSRAAREQKEFSIVMIDIDFFKLYNDAHGHLAGDDCLKKVATALQQGLQRPADLLIRYGGEEFMALLPNTGREGAISVGSTIKAAVAAAQLHHGHSATSPYVTVSIGIASTIPGLDMPVERLIDAADRALYQAKQEGRNRICISADS